MYAFMYVDTESMEEEDYFPATKTFVANYKKISTPWPVPRLFLGFSFIPLEGYDLDLNFDETKMKRKSYHSSKDKVKLFHASIVVIG